MKRSLAALAIITALLLLPSAVSGQGSVIVTSIGTTPALPVQYGNAVTWTATASGGTAPLQYQFWRRSDASGTWTLVQDYSTTASYTWTPTITEVGAYNLQVWVRSAGSTASYEAFRSTPLFAITGGPPAIISSITASPASQAPVGTAITWTAIAALPLPTSCWVCSYVVPSGLLLNSPCW